MHYVIILLQLLDTKKACVNVSLEICDGQTQALLFIIINYHLNVEKISSSYNRIESKD